MVAVRNGSAQLRDIAVRCRAAGQGALFNQVRAEIRVAAKPLVDAAQAAARERLPKSGGLNEVVASQHVTISTRTGARTAGVRLAGPRNIRSGGQTNRGFVRHPVFGTWLKGQKAEEIPQAQGWWTHTLATRSPAVTPRIVAIINRVNRWIQAGGLG